MKLSMFREKLTEEIKEVETIIQRGSFLSQRVQVHIYCIAALLRRIMMRLTQFQKVKISVYEVPDGNFSKSMPKNNQQGARHSKTGEMEIQLQSLVNKILHYSSFHPTIGKNGTVLNKEFITILSDRDKCLSKREIAITDFIGVAKQVAEDDEAVLTSLSQHTKTYLQKVINSTSEDKFSESETQESLMDFFALARETEKRNWLDGKITLYHEKFKGFEIVALQTCEVDYKVLNQKLFSEWHFTPFRQFEPYQRYANTELFNQKIIDLQCYSDETFGPVFEGHDAYVFSIRAKDLLDVLCAITV